MIHVVETSRQKGKRHYIITLKVFLSKRKSRNRRVRVRLNAVLRRCRRLWYLLNLILNHRDHGLKMLYQNGQLSKYCFSQLVSECRVSTKLSSFHPKSKIAHNRKWHCLKSDGDICGCFHSLAFECAWLARRIDRDVVSVSTSRSRDRLETY